MWPVNYETCHGEKLKEWMEWHSTPESSVIFRVQQPSIFWVSSSQLSRELPSCWRTGCNADCRGCSAVGSCTIGSGWAAQYDWPHCIQLVVVRRERLPCMFPLTTVGGLCIPGHACVGCCSNEKAVSWKKPWADVELGLWSMLTTAAVVKTPLNACWGQINRQWKILHTRYWQHQLKQARLDHMKYTSPNYFGNLWVHVSMSTWTFRAICILGEVFLYSACDIYDTQTITNRIRYIAPILLFVSENWRPSWILHFEASGASKLQFTHQKLAQHPENM